MSRNMTAILVFAAAMIVMPGAWAEGSVAEVTDMEALRTAVKADKKAFVAATLALTDAEAKKFWPIYDAYQRAVDLANRKRNLAIQGLIGRDKPLTDLYAKALLKDLFDSDDTEIAARRTMQNRLLRALPAKKVARYLQLEAKIRATQAYDMATTFPLVK
jgi:hypothetical protein